MRLGLAVALATALAASPSLAIQRTFVASTGNDANACTLGAPCRSFTAALLKTSGFGEIIVLDSAGYGPVTIAKSVSIISPSGIYAGISVSSGDNGVTVNAPGATVVLSGLSINGQGGSRGIEVQAASRVRVENCVVSNFAGEGIFDAAAGSEMIVVDTIVRDNGNSGIELSASASIVLDHVRTEHNGVQGFAMGPASGDATASVRDSLFARNAVNGIIVTSGPGTTALVQVERSVMSSNGGAGFFAFASASGGQARGMLTRNAIAHNDGAGVLLSSDGTGSASGFVADNAIYNNHNGIQLQGGTAFATASANTANWNFPDVACDFPGRVSSSGDNRPDGIAGSCATVSAGW